MVESFVRSRIGNERELGDLASIVSFDVLQHLHFRTGRNEVDDDTRATKSSCTGAGSTGDSVSVGFDVAGARNPYRRRQLLSDRHRGEIPRTDQS